MLVSGFDGATYGDQRAMIADTSVRAYEFGPYRIDTTERLLRRGTELISLPPQGHRDPPRARH